MSARVEQSEFQRADVQAFGTLIAEHQKAVFTVAYCQTGDAIVSEDLAQEAFLQAWRGRESLQDLGSFRPWVCAIARNLARNENRRRKRHPEHDEQPETKADDSSALEGVLLAERQALLWSCLETLNSPYREVLSLYYQQGQSAAAVAGVLGISPALVNQRLKRGRDQLRDQMQELVLEDLERLEPAPGFRKRVLALAGMPTLSPFGVSASSTSGLLGTFMLANILKLAGIALVAALIGVFLITRDGGDEVLADSKTATPETSTEAVTEAPVRVQSTAKNGMDLPKKDPKVAPVDSEKLLTFEIPSDESGAIWYRLHEKFPDCARALLGEVADESSSEVKLHFMSDGTHSVLKDATLSAGSSADGQAAFEQCVRQALEGRTFAKGQSEISVRFAFAQRKSTPEADREMLHALPAAVGPAALGPSRGADDAPVVLVVYTDFQCTYCARALSTMDELLEIYSGKIRIVTKLYPLKTSSRLLAEATVAAAMQDAFWPMHDLVFANQDLAELSDATIMEFASQIGLYTELFASDWASENVADIVQQDLDDGKALGVQGTPTIFVNYEKIVGAQPIENFQEVIDGEL